jgi:hypothetical protein
MLNRIGQGVAAQLFGLLVTMLDRVVLVGALIRTWGAPVYADWALLSAAAAMLALVEAGLNIYFGNAWQSAHARNDCAGFARLQAIATTIYGVLLVGISTVAIVYLVLFEPASRLGLRVVDHPTGTAVLALLGAAVALRMCRGMIAQLYRGLGLFARGIFLDSLVSLATVASVLSALTLGSGMITIAALYLATEICAGWLVMISDLRRRRSDLIFAPAAPTRAEIAALFSQLPWLAVVQGAPNLWLNLPVVLLGTIVGGGNAVVSFVLLRTLVNFARQLVNMLSIAAGVELATLAQAAAGPGLVARRLGSVGLLGCTVSAVICSGLYIFLFPLIDLWTGRTGLADASVLAWLIAGMLASAPTMPLLAMSVLGANPRAAAIASLSQVSAGLALALAGVLAFGVTGFVAGLVAGEIIAQLLVAPALVARTILSFSWFPYLGRCLTRIFACGAWCIAIGALAVAVFGTGTFGGVIVAALAWALAGAIPAVLAGLDADLRGAILALLLRR